MCLDRSRISKYDLKCTVIAVGSLVHHMILACVSITALAGRINNVHSNIFLYYLNLNTASYIGNINKNTLLALSSIFLAVNILGMFASVMLMLGSKYNKPGYVIVYVCYYLQTGILLLIGGLLFCLKGLWAFAIFSFCLSALHCIISIKANNIYEAMVQNASVECQNRISDLTFLIQEDPSDDMMT